MYSTLGKSFGNSMEKKLWETNDPVWMEEREREWAHVKANLDKMDPVIPRRSHKYHKELFFEGKLDPILSDTTAMLRDNIDSPFDWYLPIFRMWYLPECNLESYQEIFDSQTSMLALGHCRSFLFSVFRLSIFPTDYGMLGGREEIFVKTFFLGLNYKEKISKEGDIYTYSYDPRSTQVYCVSHTSAVLTTSGVNPFAPGQYLWDHVSYNFDHYPDECFENDKDVIRLRRCLRKILDWDDREDAPRERKNVLELRMSLFERFEAGDFSVRLMQYWKEEKLAYENGEPAP